MADEDLRRLEREAARGDPESAQAQVHAECRAKGHDREERTRQGLWHCRRCGEGDPRSLYMELCELDHEIEEWDAEFRAPAEPYARRQIVARLLGQHGEAAALLIRRRFFDRGRGEREVLKFLPECSTGLALAKQGLAKGDKWLKADCADYLRRAASDSFEILLKEVQRRATRPVVDVLCAEDPQRALAELRALAGRKRSAPSLPVCRGLVRLGDPAAALEGLLALLGEERDREVLEQVVELLGEVGDVAAVEPLLAYMKSPRPQNFGTLAQALGRIGDEVGIAAMCAAARERGGDAGLSCLLQGLPEGGPLTPELREVLVASLAEESVSLRTHRSVGFAQLREAGFDLAVEVALSDRDPRTRKHALDVVIDLGRGYCGPTGPARVEFSSCGDPVPTLLAIARAAEPGFAFWAVSGLGDFPDPRAVEYLLTQLDGEFRKFAASALSQIRDPAALGPLLERWPELPDTDWALRSTWLSALCSLDAPGIDAILDQARSDPTLRRSVGNAWAILQYVRDRKGQ